MPLRIDRRRLTGGLVASALVPVPVGLAPANRASAAIRRMMGVATDVTEGPVLEEVFG